MSGGAGSRILREHEKRGQTMDSNMPMRWFGGALLMVAAAFVCPLGAAADDERQLQAETKQLDADAARAAGTADGQRRVTERIARQFNVQPSVVTDLRNRRLGYGEATIALALSAELMKRDSALDQQAALAGVLAQRQAGKGWGVIAREQGVKLGQIVSEVKKADKAVEQIAAKPERSEKSVAKVEKRDKPEKVERVEKPEKIEKPAKPDKAGR